MISPKETQRAIFSKEKVIYIPFKGCDEALHETGEITRLAYQNNEHPAKFGGLKPIAFVKYDGQTNSKATDLYDLYLLEDYLAMKEEKELELERERKKIENPTRIQSLEFD